MASSRGRIAASMSSLFRMVRRVSAALQHGLRLLVDGRRHLSRLARRFARPALIALRLLDLAVNSWKKV